MTGLAKKRVRLNKLLRRYKPELPDREGVWYFTNGMNRKKQLGSCSVQIVNGRLCGVTDDIEKYSNKGIVPRSLIFIPVEEMAKRYWAKAVGNFL